MFMFNEMELWLLGTALAFTIVGWYMGKGSGVRVGIENTLEVMVAAGVIKIKMIGGEEHIVLPDDKPFFREIKNKTDVD